MHAFAKTTTTVLMMVHKHFKKLISVTNSTAMSFDINSPKIRSPMRPKLTEDDLGMAERRFDPGESPIVYMS